MTDWLAWPASLAAELEIWLAPLSPWLEAVARWLGPVLVLSGAGFFLAGTVGLLRFPDVFSRLHALTKADNLGLGLVAAGLAWESGAALVAAKLVLVWLLALLASSVSCHLIARYALRTLPVVWRSDP